MEEKEEITKLYFRKRWSIKKIARERHHSRKTVRRAPNDPYPPVYRTKAPLGQDSNQRPDTIRFSPITLCRVVPPFYWSCLPIIDESERQCCRFRIPQFTTPVLLCHDPCWLSGSCSAHHTRKTLKKTFMELE